MITLGSLTNPRGTDGVHIGVLDMNPFADKDILSGTQVVEVRLDAIRSLPPDHGEIVASASHPDIPNWDSDAAGINAADYP